MSRLSEIRTRCDAGRPIKSIDVRWMLTEIERLEEKLQDQEYQLSLQAMEQSRDEAIARAEKVEAELSALRIPKLAVSIKTDAPVQIGRVQFGPGCTIWKCPCCGAFLTPAHRHCSDCGQAVSFTVLEKEKKHGTD